MSKLELGRVVMTVGISEKMDYSFKEFVDKCLERHKNADWGDLDKNDKKSNDYALEHEGRLLSSYVIPEEIKISDRKIFIITEWNRSVTTVLFPVEY